MLSPADRAARSAAPKWTAAGWRVDLQPVCGPTFWQTTEIEDADALLALVDPVGPTCHTGSPSCFFRRVNAEGHAAEEGRDAAAFLEACNLKR